MASLPLHEALTAIETLLDAQVASLKLITAKPITVSAIPDDKFPAVLIYELPGKVDHTATSQTDIEYRTILRFCYRYDGNYTLNNRRDDAEAILDAFNGDPQLTNGGAPTCIYALLQEHDTPAELYADDGTGQGIQDFLLRLRLRRDN